jgi:two-component system, cell cycle sensor histidine kinase and response regulator CckA
LPTPFETAHIESTWTCVPRAGAPERCALLLDDEEAILLPTAMYFRSLGFTVDMAREPEEAEALIQHRLYQLAILDLRVTPFGGAQGLDVLREIKRLQRETSVIVLSAYISPELEAEAWALGADGVLSKPQSLPELARLALGLMGSAK